MRGAKTWIQATEDAVVRVCQRKGTTIFDLNSLRAQELPKIVEEVQSTGKTPDRSLEKFLQDLRDQGKIRFLDDQGNYELLDEELLRLARRI